MITKFKLYNESLKDKLKGKTKKELLNSLNYDPTITFKPTKKSIGASWLIGEWKTTGKKLYDLFGKPKKEDFIGNNFLWTLIDNNGKLVSIYDNNSNLSANEIMTKPYNWHIGGTDKKDANNLIGYIINNTM